MSFQPPPSAAHRQRARSLLLMLIIILGACGLCSWWWYSPIRSSPLADVWTDEQYEQEESKEFNRLNTLIRRYNRRKAEWLRSEDRYLEDLHLYFLAYSQLAAQQTPGLFAGEVPAHDERAFDNYMEAAEAVLEESDRYCEKFDAKQDKNSKIESVREEVTLAVAAVFPGSGNKMNDARDAILLPEFAEVKARTDEHLKEVFQGGFVDSLSTTLSIMDSVLKALNK